ncbi:FG-GAP repeat domain-containing protein [Schlesneria sp.]|uniref:FG-GAP repeat domain-containing protein n=1 Tax=Schlesneria sp. TaxID=2762018 RepID=UPI002EF73601
MAERKFVHDAALFFTILAYQLGFAAEPQKFVDDLHADFVAGKFDDGGHNFYPSKDGTLRTINRFDLNSDGYLDLLFNCTHNTYQMLPASAGTVAKDRTTQTAEITVEGSQRCAIADLNHDGYSDVVFCPNPIGVHHNRRFVMIAWGGPDGWSSHRINSPLPIEAAASVDIVDLNGDGWEDIAVLGGSRWMPQQPPGRIIRLYWGSPAGFNVTEYHDLGIPEASDLASGDFDQDGKRDLAILRSDGKLSLIWSSLPEAKPWSPTSTEVTLPMADSTCLASGDISGDSKDDLVVGSSAAALTLVVSAEGRTWSEPVRIPAFPATQITIADLDQDKRADIVLTQFDQARAAGGEQAGVGKNANDVVRVFWGDASGYAANRITNLEAPIAVATAAGDLDGDGNIDLAVAVHQGQTTFNGESFPWFGDGQRNFKRGEKGFQTSGTLHVAVAPAEKELPARAVFCNSIGGELDEAVPLHMYWGSPQGFDPQNLWKLPFHSGYESSAADLNADGFTDLIILNSGHAGEHAHSDETLGANILWGTPEGLEKATKRTVLHEHFLGTSGVADLNRDGYLDLVLEPFGPDHPGEPEELYIYYGGADGYSPKRRAVLVLGGYAQEHLIADFNRDNWLDIAVTSRSLDCVRILWGSPEGYDTSREQRLKISGPLGVDAADFNGDGWLDLLSASYNDPVSGHRDMGLVIFWGEPTGYQHANAQWLPGFSPLGRTIADFDSDGYLDIFSPQHSGELTREDLACHLYWGSKSGFGTRKRTTIFADSVNDSLAGDFNGDGKIDLAVNCHTRHGDHRTLSKVFYNDGARFENPTIQKLPTNGPHLLWAADIGHIYNRKYRHAFESRVFEWSDKANSVHLSAKVTLPEKTLAQFSVRSAADKSKLDKAAWTPIEKQSVPVAADHRAIQYRAVLVSDNGDRYPQIERVELKLEK